MGVSSKVLMAPGVTWLQRDAHLASLGQVSRLGLHFSCPACRAREERRESRAWRATRGWGEWKGREQQTKEPSAGTGRAAE